MRQNNVADSKRILAEAMAANCLANRSTLYNTPGLEQYRPNGSSAINSKIQQLLTAFVTKNGGEASFVKDHVKAGRSTPTKRKKAKDESVGDEGASPIKRRVVKKETKAKLESDDE